MLIRNMPIHEEDRYGVLKDQICLLFNSLDIRYYDASLREIRARKAKKDQDDFASAGKHSVGNGAEQYCVFSAVRKDNPRYGN